MIQKVRNKSKSFWKHGKHGSMIGIAARKNREKAPRRKLDVIDISKSDWGRR